MSDAAEVLELLAGNRVLVYVRDGRLRFLAPAGAYTPELRGLVDSYRGELRRP